MNMHRALAVKRLLKYPNRNKFSVHIYQKVPVRM